MNKKECIEQKIREIVKEIIPKEKAIELKKNSGEDELEIERLVEQNYHKNFLKNVKNGKDIVLIMGINPGGGDVLQTDEKIDCYYFSCFDKELIDKNDKAKKLYNLLYNKYIHQNYHYNNYKLFESIGGKLYWTCENENKLQKELEKILLLENVSNNDFNEYKEALKYIYDNEKMKNGPLVFFSDLIYYADKCQENIKKILEKEEDDRLNHNIEKIIDLFIEYYNPKILVITNAYASDLVRNAFKHDIGDDIVDAFIYKKNNKNTQIIFSSMVSGGRTLDKYSFVRLKKDITEKYNKIKEKNNGVI